MKKICWILVLIVLTSPVFAERVTIFKDLAKPAGFYLDNDHFYIIEFPHIYVYSLKDYSLIKKFGEKGEGPGCFLRYARLHFHSDYIIVQSSTRFSYFTKDWKFIKERKIPITFDRGVTLMGNRFVASHTAPHTDDPKQTDLVVNIYDSNNRKIKEVYRQKYFFQVGKKVNSIYLPELGRRMGLRYFICDNKIFVEGEDGETGTIYVYNDKGEKIRTLQHRFEKLKVRKEHIKTAEEYYRIRGRRLYSILKERGWLYHPQYFPAVRYLKGINNKIYIIPYKKKQGKNQLFIFDLEGKLLKQVAAPIAEESIFSFYPSTIKDGKLIQLIENEKEEWELHITGIE